MRMLILSLACLLLSACVQDEGQVSNGSVNSGNTSGSSTGGSSTSGGSSGGSSSTDDPLYVYQWHLNNSGQDVGSYVDLGSGIDTTPVSGIDLNAEEAHDLGYTGRGVTIAVSDSGTDYNHPDLDGNFLADGQRNYAPLDPNRWADVNADSYPSGNQAHGTAVAGIIASEGWNGIGGRGVAPEASFTAFKYVLDYASFDHLASSTDKLIHNLMGDFDIFNYSYGYNQCYFIDDYDPDVIDTLKDQIDTGRSNRGTIYVQAAGNSFEESICFGNTAATATLNVPYKIVAAAISANGVKSSYSTPGSAIWVSAFGGEGMTDFDPTAATNAQYVPAIFTTDIQDCSSGFSYRNPTYQLKNPFDAGYDTDLNPHCDYTNTMNGTSSATPMVSGVVALMLQAKPSLTWREVKHILAETAVVIDYDVLDNELVHPSNLITFGTYVYDYKWEMNAANKWYSNWYGFGLVDAEAAVQMAKNWTSGSLGTYQRTENAAGTWFHTSSNSVPMFDDGDMTHYAEDTIAGVTALTIESVQIRLTTNHTYPGELSVHLVSPSNTERRILTADSFITATGGTTYYFSTNAFRGENSGGDWKIRIYDPNPGDTGDIQGWGINIHGH